MKERRIRVIIVDDHPIVRKGTSALITEYEDIEVVGEAGNGKEAIELIEKGNPDVILMDLKMPEMDGIAAVRYISAHYPQTRILVLTGYGSDDKVFPAIKAGALGYMLKDSHSGELGNAIRAVFRGEPFLEASIARKVLLEFRKPQPEKAIPEPLTERETEVLRLLASGLDNGEIAGRLNITEPTVRSHINRIFSKLHLANRIQATLYALREGLTKLDDFSKR